MKFTITVCCVMFFLSTMLNAQFIKPGFDLNEYIELMLVSVKTTKSAAYSSKFPESRRFSMIYQSEDLKMENSWDLWEDNDGVALISIRGTTTNFISWAENFYAAMIPARGEVVFEGDEKFTYNLCKNPRAGVHAGWLIGTALIYRDLKPHLDSLMDNGVRSLLITGHSQGGALAIILSSYLISLRATGDLPIDLQMKTYASAAPKPGNTYFAYEYEQNTQAGYSYNVVNPLDWVPEAPITIQTIDDFNNTNPFIHSDEMIRSQKLPSRLVYRRIYNKLDKPTRKAQKNYEKILGKMTHKIVEKELGKVILPPYIPSSNFVRVGNTIVLSPDESYHLRFPEDHKNVFNHHLHESYLHLARLGVSEINDVNSGDSK